MSLLLTYIPKEVKKRWKKWLKDSNPNITTGALISKFLETYMGPLNGALEKHMNLQAVCDKCGNNCDIIYKKNETYGCVFPYSACCQSSFRYESPPRLVPAKGPVYKLVTQV